MLFLTKYMFQNRIIKFYDINKSIAFRGFRKNKIRLSLKQENRRFFPSLIVANLLCTLQNPPK